MAKQGDTVRFLNSVGGGRIVRIEGPLAYVEDEDGFEVPALLKECVVVMQAQAQPNPEKKVTVEYGKPATPAAPAASKEVPAPRVNDPAPLDISETPEGEKLNVVLGFMSDDLKRITSSGYTAELVNDSNYYLSFALSVRAEDSTKWHLLKAATVEPNTVLTLFAIEAADLQQMDRLMFQCVAFKEGREYAEKPAVTVTHKVDTTKFFKLHCFRDNVYFDVPVIAFDLVRDDRPYAPISVDPVQMKEAMKEKRRAERPVVRPVKKRDKPAAGQPLVVDLHIEELTDSVRGLSAADMLNMQVDEFRSVMDRNLKNHGQKIIFIHGKGEGVLRNALLKELNHRYKGNDVQDASFAEYGYGATQVTVR